MSLSDDELDARLRSFGYGFIAPIASEPAHVSLPDAQAAFGGDIDGALSDLMRRELIHAADRRTA